MTAADLLTAEEAASLLRVNVRRVQALARAGRLPARRTGRRWLFPRQALLDSLAGHALPAPPAPPPSPLIGVDISARNQLRGRIARLTVDGLMAEVEIGIGEQCVVSLITRHAAERLGLAVGQEVLAVIKSTEIMVARPAR